MNAPTEVTRIAAPCTVGQLLKLLDAVEAGPDCTIRHYNGSLRIERAAPATAPAQVSSTPAPAPQAAHIDLDAAASAEGNAS